MEIDTKEDIADKFHKLQRNFLIARDHIAICLLELEDLRTRTKKLLEVKDERIKVDKG